MSARRWSHAELDVMRRNYADRPTAAIAAQLGRTVGQIYQCAGRLGLRKSAAYLAGPLASGLRRGGNIGAEYRFKKGQTPHNKGKKMPASVYAKVARTMFKPGEMHGAAARKYKPIGSLRMSKDGYLERKVTDDHPVPTRRWVGVHRLVWEAEHGPIPDGHIVVFKAGRRTTDVERITVDALELITRVENMQRNTYHRYPKEIARCIQLRGAIQRQINRRSRDTP